MKFSLIIACSFLILTLSACGGSGGGGGDDDDDVGITRFDGTWRGNLEDPLGTMHTLTLTISGDTITSALIDGIDQGITGIIGQESADVYGYTLSDASEGGLIVDSISQHMTILDEDFNVGVLQKNAGALPPFVQSDIAGRASGAVVITDTVTFQEFSGSITCDAAGACTGNDDQIGDFTITLTYTDLGRWIGLSTFATGTADVSAFMSTDKQFVGSWACDFAVGGFPDACSFSAWSYQ
jgi:hypothetical protein